MLTSFLDYNRVSIVHADILTRKYKELIQESHTLDGLIENLEDDYDDGVILAEKYYSDQIHQQILNLEDQCKSSLVKVIEWFEQLDKLFHDFKSEWISTIKKYYISLSRLSDAKFNNEYTLILKSALDLDILATLAIEYCDEDQQQIKRRKINRRQHKNLSKSLREAIEQSNFHELILEKVDLALISDEFFRDQQNRYERIHRLRWVLNY